MLSQKEDENITQVFNIYMGSEEEWRNVFTSFLWKKLFPYIGVFFLAGLPSDDARTHQK